MQKLIILLLLIAFDLGAQSKKPVQKNAVPAPVVQDTVVVEKDTIDPGQFDIVEAGKFAVYTRKAIYNRDNRMKLCFFLVKDEKSLIHCMNDSICKFPEVYKVLFEKQDADTSYLLIYVDAVTKVLDKPSCDAGHETKLVFVKWNLTTNKAAFKQRNISSCMKAITNMTKEPVANWDGASVLTVNYHRGGTVFVELKFDPNQYKLGMQSNAEAESKQ